MFITPIVPGRAGLESLATSSGLARRPSRFADSFGRVARSYPAMGSGAITVPPPRDLAIALHCSGSSARQWRALVEALEPACRVLAVDLHGHGVQGPWPAERSMTLADEAALIEPLLAQASHLAGRGARVHLVGHSYGGAVALKVASQHPQRLASVAVFEPVLFGLLREDPASAAESRQAQELGRTMQLSLADGHAARAAQYFVDYWSGPGTWTRLPEARRASMAAHVPAVAAQFTALFTEPVLSAASGALGRIKAPMLVLTGEYTVASTQRIGQRLRTLMPSAQHETLAGLGHMGPLTHTHTVNERFVSHVRAGGIALGPNLVPPPGRAPAAARRLVPSLHSQEALA